MTATKLSFTLIAAALLAACGSTPPGPTVTHPAVARYVAGWQEHDGAKVRSAFSAGGRYQDPSLRAPVAADALPAHVAEHKPARFELVKVTQPIDNRIELHWKAHWPDARGSYSYTDTVKLDGAAIESVDSMGLAPASAARLIADYEVTHDQPTPERMQALFTRDFEAEGTNLPLMRWDAYVAFLEKLRGTTFKQVPGTPLMQTKDGRLVMRWTLTAGPKQLAAGVDYLTVDNGRIRKIVGHF